MRPLTGQPGRHSLDCVTPRAARAPQALRAEGAGRRMEEAMIGPRGRFWIAVAAMVSIAFVTGCGAPKKAPTDVDPKLTNTAYFEEGDLMTFVVGIRAALSREDKGYIPLQIAIVNNGLEGITINREFFTLVDENGNRYAPVGFDELKKDYRVMDLDKKLADLDGVILGKYQAFQQEPSTLTESFDRPTLLVTKLPKFSYIIDWLYFPKPEEGAKGRRFELFLDAPELPDPVFVRFRVED
jgi:hypothetical protein